MMNATHEIDKALASVSVHYSNGRSPKLGRDQRHLHAKSKQKRQGAEKQWWAFGIGVRETLLGLQC